MSSFGSNGEKRGKHAKHAKTDESVDKTEKVSTSSSASKHGKAKDSIKDKDDVLFDDSDGEGAFFSQGDDETEAIALERAKGCSEDATEVIKKGSNITEPLVVGDGIEEGVSDEDDFATGFIEATTKEPKDYTKLKKGLAIGFGSFFALLLIVYIVGVVVFSDRLYPNTRLGDMDVSMQTSADLHQTMSNRIEGYILTVTGPNGFSQRISASDIGLALDGSVTLSQMVPNRSPFTWPVDIFMSHDISENVATSYNLAIAQSTVSSAVAKYNETATQPTNATIAYNSTKKAYEVVPEKAGTALDESKVATKIANAISSLTTTVKLTDEDLVQPTILSTDSRMSAAVAQAEKMGKADVAYTLGGVEVAHVSPTLIATWITLDQNYQASLDEAKLVEWARATAEPLNTRGSERTYTRADGKVVTVSGGDYGWEVDVDAFVAQVQSDVAAGTTATSAVPCTADGEGEGFTQVGGADWGKRYVDVDLSEQYARFYDSDGSLIWECDFISGAPTSGKATPTGVYYIKTKESPSKLVGYLDNGAKDYETTVSFWMPFIGNAIGFHDATWQPGFGGNMYAQGYGSHGCINISYGDAQALYSIIEPNDVVVVHD